MAEVQALLQALSEQYQSLQQGAQTAYSDPWCFLELMVFMQNFKPPLNLGRN